MSLKENTSYDSASKAMSSMANKIGSITKRMRKKSTPNRKSVNTSQYNNLANNVKSNLGTTTVPYGGSTKFEKFHPGVDLANDIGTPIPAFTGGKVVDVRTGQKQGSPDFGNYIIVQDSEGNKFRYSHLNSEYVKVGDTVAKGQPIGEIGNTGQTYSEHGGTGAHLDLRIKDIYGKYIDPSPWI